MQTHDDGVRPVRLMRVTIMSVAGMIMHVML